MKTNGEVKKELTNEVVGGEGDNNYSRTFLPQLFAGSATHLHHLAHAGHPVTSMPSHLHNLAGHPADSHFHGFSAFRSKRKTNSIVNKINVTHARLDTRVASVAGVYPASPPRTDIVMRLPNAVGRVSMFSTTPTTSSHLLGTHCFRRFL
ncbi:hypothetical protein KQX54_000697 [Cotesia glomerata]|uniref:Uncharacterized protein n=1 Tax=Cotesia glomerata TaxID=32391 RepID=A0AAV7J114_COTGL|nr:hypothetical protein KQX54_000697 [Cotesia glomerata]